MLDYLPEILSEGLYSRTILRKEKSGRYMFTDKVRLDKKPSRISLSVSYPNWKMFYNKRKNNDAEGWVLLMLDSKILWELDCWFIPKNAASGSEYKGSKSSSCEKFVEMFDDTNRSNLYPLNWTTDVQAEVMVKDKIPAEYIKSIFVENYQDKELCEQKCKPNIEIIINKKFFGPRTLII
jgi:hypothetical protein